MGLRDALKAKVKGLLGATPAPSAAPKAQEPAAKSVGAVATSGATPRAAAPSAPPPKPDADTWTPVSPSSRVTDDKPGTFSYQRYNVSVYRYLGRLYAMDDACAHEDGPIAEGALDGSCVVCPYHDWRYDFTTGACLTEPERQRATFAVKEESGQIWLGERLTRGSDSRGGDHDDGMEVIKT